MSDTNFETNEIFVFSVTQLNVILKVEKGMQFIGKNIHEGNLNGRLLSLVDHVDKTYASNTVRCVDRIAAAGRRGRQVTASSSAASVPAEQAECSESENPRG